jgi:cytochrome P450
MDVLLEGTFRRIGRVVDVPLWVPTPGNRRFRSARLSLDRVVYRVIDERRRQPDASADLLTRLLRASDSETGSGMSGEQLRDQTITLLLSGHETTANALSWALHLVSTHGEVESRLRAELDSVLGGRDPVAADLSKLHYTTMVLYEAMRLYPPIWILERYAAEDDDIGGYRIPARSTVVVSPFTLHRHEAFWPSPEEFRPERFADLAVAERQPTAYLPFGAGPHHCVGAHFALLEARVVLAMVVQAFQLRPLPGHVVEPKAEITLRFRNGLHMTAHPRTERAL